jgi:hypothetical protein
MFKVQKHAIGNPKGAEVVETSVQKYRKCSKFRNLLLAIPRVLK